MKKFRPFLVFGLFLLFLLPNLTQIVRGSEHFPFSNNPMFGHNISTLDTLATISFIIENNKGVRSQVDFDELGLWEVRFKRYYFSNIYGSSEKNSPQRNVSSAQSKFIENNTTFFKKFSKLILSKGINCSKIYLKFDLITPDNRTSKETNIGYFDLTNQGFIML